MFGNGSNNFAQQQGFNPQQSGGGGQGQLQFSN